jgi:hypothetical protein
MQFYPDGFPATSCREETDGHPLASQWKDKLIRDQRSMLLETGIGQVLNNDDKF